MNYFKTNGIPSFSKQPLVDGVDKHKLSYTMDNEKITVYVFCDLIKATRIADDLGLKYESN